MQIFKCLKKRIKPAQNLLEFIFILPILIFVTLVMFETALFWQDVNSIYDLNAEINANVALSDNSNMALNSTCTSATEALDILEKKDAMISMNNPAYTKTILDGSEPFALYKYEANTITVGGVTKPQIALWVDCRNPFENGITTQIEFYHKTIVIKASIPRFDKGEAIEVIPEHIFIASPKLNTVKHF
ncbi:MAG: hypothetical protein PHC64_01725 [Candidatus Gastranaerophilales bacterium]|nr:hypothetical protein [Candidatus Gastranaerophilales bacterium]